MLILWGGVLVLLPLLLLTIALLMGEVGRLLGGRLPLLLLFLSVLFPTEVFDSLFGIIAATKKKNKKKEEEEEEEED